MNHAKAPHKDAAKVKQPLGAGEKEQQAAPQATKPIGAFSANETAPEEVSTKPKN